MDSQTAANPFGEVYEEIKHEMVLLHWTWQTYRRAVCHEQSAVHVACRIAP